LEIIMNRNEKLVASRYIPKNATVIKSKKSESVVYMFLSISGAPCAIGYAGKASKPAFNHRYLTAKSRLALVTKWLQNEDRAQAYRDEKKAKEKKAREEGHDLQVGDVLTGQWGYDQTNVEYYQVTALIGKRTVEIREIGRMVERTGFMSGDCVPSPNAFTTAAPLRRVVSTAGSVNLNGCCRLYKMKPVEVAGVKTYNTASWSAYA
jgi:hypothetical protein